MYILGISAFYHDSAACLIKNGEIIAAAQEERFSRIKHDKNFPKESIKFCIKYAKIKAVNIDNVVFYEKPLLKFERIIETFLAYAPLGFRVFVKAIPIWVKEKLFQKFILIKELNSLLGSNINWKSKLLFSEHHLSHAASAFYPSPFKKAAILTLDGVGEWTTTSIMLGNGNEIKFLKEINFPHSLGLLYSSFTYYLGFKVNSGEYKLMGLAPYGDPKYYNIIFKELINLANDGSFQLNMKYFDFAKNLKMTNQNFNKLFGGPPRRPESEITKREMDIAASIQKVTEEIIIKIAKNIVKETGEQNLCLAGGVALNCVVNGALNKNKIFKNIWIQPASGDSGGSLGAALAIWYLYYRKERRISNNYDSMHGSFLGPNYSNHEIINCLKKLNVTYSILTKNELLKRTASALDKNKIIGWFQGRMEFGPRSLGMRSILANPQSSNMQKNLNLKIKFRESFRPFAPSIMIDDLENFLKNVRKKSRKNPKNIIKKS